MYFLAEGCGELETIIRLVKLVFRLFQFGIPILLLLFGAIDLGKAVIASKEDEQKKAQSMLLKRAVYAILVFFLFTIVSLVMGLVTDAGEPNGVENSNAGADYFNWSDCWKSV